MHVDSQVILDCTFTLSTIIIWFGIVLVLYCHITNYHIFINLKEHPFIKPQFGRSEVWAGSSGFSAQFLSEIITLGRLSSYLEAPGQSTNTFIQVLTGFSSLGWKTEIPIFFLAVNLEAACIPHNLVPSSLSQKWYLESL